MNYGFFPCSTLNLKSASNGLVTFSLSLLLFFSASFFKIFAGNSFAWGAAKGWPPVAAGCTGFAAENKLENFAAGVLAFAEEEAG